jgi:coenzyme F420-reducing hydrogenase beta subunit
MTAREGTATVTEESLFTTVVQGGYCIGCGNCAFASNGKVAMGLDNEGFVQPRIAAEAEVDSAALALVCPFSNAVPNETKIADAQSWGETARDDALGRYAGLYAGHVTDEAYRLAGGSGGLTTWFLQSLLESGEIDHVLHVKPVDRTSDPEGRLFRYGLSSSVAELHQGRKSRYYPVDLSEAYAIILSNPGRYAVVGVPCFAKAIRLMQRRSPEVADRVRFVVGLVCGHLKSSGFAEYLGWLQGVRPSDLRSIDFRVKIPGGDAAQYTNEAGNGVTINRGLPLKEYFGTTWDLGFMKYGACEFCDDVFAETADIVFGDAWIEPFQASWLGSNVVVTRHPLAEQLIQQGIADGALALKSVTLGQMIKSQSSGLRHRREGLSHRLALCDSAGRWRPRKRFEQLVSISRQRQLIYERRMELAKITARAFARSREASSLAIFQTRVSWAVFRYYLVASGLKTAVSQSAPFKWLTRKARRR